MCRSVVRKEFNRVWPQECAKFHATLYAIFVREISPISVPKIQFFRIQFTYYRCFVAGCYVKIDYLVLLY